MQDFKYKSYLINSGLGKIIQFTFTAVLLSVIIVQPSCRKKEKKTVYEVNEAPSYRSDINKNKAKSESEYISILSANLFQKALSANALARHQRVIQSVGDKALVNEIIISNFMNKADVKMPSNEEMRADVEKFIVETYRKFYVRTPTELELTWFKNYINNNPKVTVELIYTSFSASDEYLFY
jgi:hypothetical protein